MKQAEQIWIVAGDKMAELMSKAVTNVDELKDMYNHRDIEK